MQILGGCWPKCLPATHLGELAGVPSSWLPPSSDASPVLAGICRVASVWSVVCIQPSLPAVSPNAFVKYSKELRSRFLVSREVFSTLPHHFLYSSHGALEL